MIWVISIMWFINLHLLLSHQNLIRGRDLALRMHWIWYPYYLFLNAQHSNTYHNLCILRNKTHLMFHQNKYAALIFLLVMVTLSYLFNFILVNTRVSLNHSQKPLIENRLIFSHRFLEKYQACIEFPYMKIEEIFDQQLYTFLIFYVQ